MRLELDGEPTCAQVNALCISGWRLTIGCSGVSWRMVPDDPGAPDVLSEAMAFMSGFESLIMSTVSPDGMPEASYAPYVRAQETPSTST
jgi:hypothetical protein